MYIAKPIKTNIEVLIALPNPLTKFSMPGINFKNRNDSKDS